MALICSLSLCVNTLGALNPTNKCEALTALREQVAEFDFVKRLHPHGNSF